MNPFSGAVAGKTGNYVYRLSDPRNGETFYVSRGKGNRVFEQSRCQLNLSEGEDDVSEETGRTRKIKSIGLEMMHVIHHYGIPDSAIFEVEANLINAYLRLFDINTRHSRNTKGPMVAQ